MDLQVLLRVWRRTSRSTCLDMVRITLDRMARGGIYDHLGGGFARYSVDQYWLVPHFEKMLYDNALLAACYLDAFVAMGEPNYARVVRETLDYLVRDMANPEGGFLSTEDADSEGEEGKFYVWTPQEIEQALGQPQAERFCYVYDVSHEGNFEHGRSILNLPKTVQQCAALKKWNVDELELELAQSRARLLQVRGSRVRPGRDDKLLVSWNGLAIDSFARAAVVLQEPRYLDAATKAAEFIFTRMQRQDGRLWHSWCRGQAKFDAMLDDYANLTNALVSLYEAGQNETWIDRAVTLADVMLSRFVDSQAPGFFYTADDQESLITRTKEFHDGSVPSSNAMTATALLRLGKLCGRTEYLDAARRTIQASSGLMEKAPTAAGQMLIAADLALGPAPEIVLITPHATQSKELLDGLARQYIPNRVVACRSWDDAAVRSKHLEPLFEGKAAETSQPILFVCENFTCQAPVSGMEAIQSTWDLLAKVASKS